MYIYHISFRCTYIGGDEPLAVPVVDPEGLLELLLHLLLVVLDHEPGRDLAEHGQRELPRAGLVNLHISICLFKFLDFFPKLKTPRAVFQNHLAPYRNHLDL